jgi:hypothetical protein
LPEALNIAVKPEGNDDDEEWMKIPEGVKNVRMYSTHDTVNANKIGGCCFTPPDSS